MAGAHLFAGEASDYIAQNSGVLDLFEEGLGESLAPLDQMVSSGELDINQLKSGVSRPRAGTDVGLARQIAQPGVAAMGQAGRVGARAARRNIGATVGGGFNVNRMNQLAEAEAVVAGLGQSAAIHAQASGQAAQLTTSANLAQTASDTELTKLGVGVKASLLTEKSQRIAENTIAQANYLFGLFNTIYGAKSQQLLIRESKKKDFYDKYAAIVGASGNIRGNFQNA
jgi:hypothetical protein